MAQVNSDNSTALPVDPTRRRFLSQAASVAAGGSVLALAVPPASAADVSDPVFEMIASHKKIMGTVDGIAAEINRTVEIDEKAAAALEQGVFAEQNGVEFHLFIALTEAFPTTLAGVVALVTYLDEVNKRHPWKFEDNYASPLIGSLAAAFNRMAATCS